MRARFRDKGFARHQLQGLNVFLLEMFDQFMEPDTSTPPNYSNDILGVRKSDYMSTLANDLQNAISNFVQAARQETATIELLQPKIGSQTLTADVRVTNLTGHRLPSGVGFRRAFIEFVVMDNRTIDPATGQPTVVWSSGRTNAAGVIVDGQGNPLPTEYIGTATNRKGAVPAALLRQRASHHAADAGADLRGADQGRRRQLHDQLHPPRRRPSRTTGCCRRAGRRQGPIHRR